MADKLWRITLVLTSAFVIEVLGVWADGSLAPWAIVLAHVVFLFGAFQVGRVLLSGRVAIAVLLGLLLGAIFWFASWRFIGWLMVDAFQRDNERGFMQFSGPYSLYLPPTVLMSALLAGFGAWKRKVTSPGASIDR